MTLLPVAILAGGLATRLRPMTESIPKSLIEVAGQPFILHQLIQLQRAGLTDVVLCLGYLGEQVQSLVGDGNQFGLRIQYSFDGHPLMGTGGALKRALPMLGSAFFVLYGESYLPCSFPEVQIAFENSKAPALMTVMRNANRWDKSNVLFDSGRLIEYNKDSPKPEMSHIDYGLGVVSAKVFSHYPSDSAFDLAALYQYLSKRGELAGFEVNQRFYEIGSLQGIAEAEQFLSQHNNGESHELHKTASA